MQKGKIVLGIIAILLAASGIALMNSGGQSSKVAKASTTTYTTNWQATSVYRLMRTNNGGVTQPLGAIGVSGWVVNGTIGTTTYTETWVGPAANSASFNTVTNSKCSTAGYDKTKWLVGCTSYIGGDEGRNTFGMENIAPSDVYADKPGGVGYNQWSSSGGGSYCDDAFQVFTGCAVATGSYGFVYTNLTGGIKMAGLFMPLQWTVSGTITQ